MPPPPPPSPSRKPNPATSGGGGVPAKGAVVPSSRLASIQHLLLASKYDQCVPQLLTLARDFPSDGRLLNWLAIGLVTTKRVEQGLYYAAKSVEIEPRQPAQRLTLAHALYILRRYDEALQHYALAWELGLRTLQVAHSHVGCLRDTLRWVEGVRVGRAYMQTPQVLEHPAVATLVAECEGFQGMPQEAIGTLASCEAFIAPAPPGVIARHELVAMAMCKANMLNYASDDRQAIRAAHERHASLALPPVTLASAPARSPASTTPLRLGLVSSDLRGHSCAWFIPALLKGADPSRLQVLCYSTCQTPDNVTAELRALAGHGAWRDAPSSSLDDDKLAKQIVGDRVDVLLDCAGLTSGNRLALFARRLALLQLSWLGYPTDTRVPTIDARIVDHWTDPTPSEAAFEADPALRGDEARLLRMPQPKQGAPATSVPRFICYQPPTSAPPARDGAQRAGEPFTFCCFNALQKHTPAMHQAWGSILAGVPHARLLLKARGTHVAEVRDALHARLARAGLDMTRVDIAPHTTGTFEHLACYQHCDLQLDSFPYAGTTTTFESLFMGVPVLTLAGKLHAGRVGVSLLSAIGHDELIAQDIDDYIRRAIALAQAGTGSNAPIQNLSGGLRERLTASVLCDARAFGDAFTTTIEQAWHQRVASPA